MNGLWLPGSSDGKESSCNVGDPGLVPGSGRSPGEDNGNPLQYYCLENSMDKGDWQATVHGLQRVAHDWETNTHTQTHMWNSSAIYRSILRKSTVAWDASWTVCFFMVYCLYMKGCFTDNWFFSLGYSADTFSKCIKWVSHFREVRWSRRCWEMKYC